MKPFISKGCFAYISDILIYSETKVEHLKLLKEICLQFNEAGFMANKEKIEIEKKEIQFLGHKLSENKIKISIDATAAIKNFARSKKVNDVRKFLGMTGYYRKFIKNYAKVS